MPLGFELEGPIYVRTHFVHSRSRRFGGAAPLAGYDVVWLIACCMTGRRTWRASCCARPREALAPGARIVICEKFRTPDRLAVQLFWTYF